MNQILFNDFQPIDHWSPKLLSIWKIDCIIWSARKRWIKWKILWGNAKKMIYFNSKERRFPLSAYCKYNLIHGMLTSQYFGNKMEMCSNMYIDLSPSEIKCCTNSYRNGSDTHICIHLYVRMPLKMQNYTLWTLCGAQLCDHLYYSRISVCFFLSFRLLQEFMSHFFARKFLRLVFYFETFCIFQVWCYFIFLSKE